ncbi:MAG: multicopper oxidase family protein [Micrococcales bacterium]
MQITRRTAIAGGAAAVGLTALGVAGYTLGRQYLWPEAIDGQTGEPQTLRSKNGRLEVDLVVANTLVDIGGTRVKTKTYNGSLPGPTLVAQPGDTIVVNFTNNLSESTNLHAHGLNVSPEGNSDNVMLDIKPGETFKYEYVLAADHPTGTSWYHPHLHGAAAPQLFAGLYGAIIVEKPGSPLTPTLNNDRVLVISDIDFDTDGNILEPNAMYKMMGREGRNILVNGQLTPSYQVQTNAVERWRVLNACSSRYLHLHWAGATAQLVAMDTGTLSAPESTEEVILAPGNRAELWVTFTDQAVDLTFDSVPHPDMMTTDTKGQVLASFKPSGPAAEPIAIPAIAYLPPDLRDRPVAAKRTFTLAMPTMAQMMSGDASGGDMSGMSGMDHSNMSGMDHSNMSGMSGSGLFTINGESFDPAKINTTVAMNTVEEWTIVNPTGMNHPFHLHVWPMQIVSNMGVPVKDPRWQDVVNVPYQSQVVVRVEFKDISGTTMYHCHILDHEDQGMMGQIQAK